jgi:hypothetical protein
MREKFKIWLTYGIARGSTITIKTSTKSPIPIHWYYMFLRFLCVNTLAYVVLYGYHVYVMPGEGEKGVFIRWYIIYIVSKQIGHTGYIGYSICIACIICINVSNLLPGPPHHVQ